MENKNKEISGIPFKNSMPASLWVDDKLIRKLGIVLIAAVVTEFVNILWSTRLIPFIVYLIITVVAEAVTVVMFFKMKEHSRAFLVSAICHILLIPIVIASTMLIVGWPFSMTFDMMQKLPLIQKALSIVSSIIAAFATIMACCGFADVVVYVNKKIFKSWRIFKIVFISVFLYDLVGAELLKKIIRPLALLLQPVALVAPSGIALAYLALLLIEIIVMGKCSDKSLN